MSETMYQLVIQQGGPMGDLDAWVALEERVAEFLGETATVDGHDWGAVESNIFILTSEPVLVYNALRPILATIPSLRVAYRADGDDEYAVLYPPGLSRFTVS